MTAAIESIKEHFPFTEEQLKSGHLIEYVWAIDLKSSPDRIWPFVCDTNRINKFVQNVPVKYKEEKGLLIGEQGEGVQKLEWIEYPWEWIYDKWLSRLRKYTLGPVNYNLIGAFIEKKEEGGSTLYIYLGTIIKFKEQEDYFKKYYETLGERYRMYFKNLEETLDKDPHEKITHVMKQDIKVMRDKLIELNFDMALVDKLIDFVITADDSELNRIQILKLAEQWNVDQTKLLIVSLYAVKLGLLTMSWDVICPHCRGVRTEVPFLSQIPKDGHCDICEIDFENNTEDSIEVVFHVHPSFREVGKIFYCAAEPSHKPHIKIQKKVVHQDHIEAVLPNHDYHSRAIGGVDHEKYRVTIDKKPLNDHEMACSIDLVNPDQESHIYVVEDDPYKPKYFLRPADLFATQSFRELFADEKLPTDLNMEIGEQTVMFIDTANSGKFYEKYGDAKAFNVIKAFYVNLADRIKTIGGAIVKTMGDGALIHFHSPIEALIAACEIRDFANRFQNTTDFKVKITLNTGRCLAVNYNSQIDLFGQAVNLAIRMQMGAMPGDILIPKELYEKEEIKKYISDNKLKVSTLVIVHYSLTKPLDAIKLTC